MTTSENGRTTSENGRTTSENGRTTSENGRTTSENGRVWFLTGTSRGFGRLWTEAALRRGDRVAATARDVEALADLTETYGEALLPITLDVTDRDAVFDAVSRTAQHFGRLDVVVNNAGYGHFGAVEELSEDEIRGQLETNLFGALWVIQAALPVLRAQGSGHIVNVTSEGGIRAFPGIGAYHASKWALEGLAQSLAQEVGEFGIRVTNVEPGPYGTGWLETGARHSAGLPCYDRLRGSATMFEIGDPAATVPALMAVLDSPEPPLRVFFGRSFEPVRVEYLDRLAEWERWQDVALDAFGTKVDTRCAERQSIGTG